MSDVLFVNTIFEGFLIKIKVAFLSGTLLSSPVHVYNLIKFIFPGLTVKEKKVIVGIFLLSALLTPPDFISQVSLALPMILLFFLTILIAKIFKFGEG